MFRRALLPIMAILIGSMILGSPPSADAAFKLRIMSGLSTVLVEDQDFVPNIPNTDADLNPTLGIVSYLGIVGGFNVTFASGTSKPVLGNAFTAEMDLATFTVASSGAGTITIELSDQDFTLPGSESGAFLESVLTASTTGGSTVQTEVFVNDCNCLFGAVGDLYTDTGLLSGVIASQLTDTGALNGTFSITIRMTYTATAAGQSLSGDARATVTTPEPVTLTALGTALPVLGFCGALRRYRGRKEQG
jgi:hypothetical protein